MGASCSTSEYSVTDSSCLPCPGSNSLGCLSAGINASALPGVTGQNTGCENGYTKMGGGPNIYAICCAPREFPGGLVNAQDWGTDYSPTFLNCMSCVGAGIAKCIAGPSTLDSGVVSYPQGDATACDFGFDLFRGECQVSASSTQHILQSRSFGVIKRATCNAGFGIKTGATALQCLQCWNIRGYR